MSTMSSSNASLLSTRAIQQIVSKLELEKYRDLTKQTYYRVWKVFNEFFIKLDVKPTAWEDRITLFAAFLINEGKQSATVKSYISAIKSVLQDNFIEINEDAYLLNSLTRACRIHYDQINICRPIQKEVLNILLKAIEFHFMEANQMYLLKLYMALFAASYYGLFRIGEVTDSKHMVKANNVHIWINKKKLLFILRSLKTHTEGMFPQSIKISSTVKITKRIDERQTYYCPFALLQSYLSVRGWLRRQDENFFIFRDHTPVKPQHFRTTLKLILTIVGFDSNQFSVHSFRAGRAVDLLHYGDAVDTIKKLGQWCSNAIYAYLKY